MNQKITRVGVAVLWAAVCIVLIFLLAGGYFGGGVNRVNPSVRVGSELLREEQAAAEGVQRLSISAGSPSVHIRGTDSNTFTARHYGAENTPDNEKVVVRRDGDTLRIEIPHVSRIHVGIWFVNERLEIEVPYSWLGAVNGETSSGSLNINDSFSWKETTLQTSSGSLRIERSLSVDGPFSARTSSGSLNLDELNAASADLQTSSGSLRANRTITVAGPFRAQTSSGSLRLDVLTAESAELTTTSGTLNAGGRITLTGELKASTSSGSLRLEGEVQAKNVRASTSSGHLTADSLKTETYDLATTSGGISGGRITGAGRMKSSSGSISADVLSLTGDTDISATSGTVRVGLPRELPFNFEGTTTSGTINGDYELYYRDTRKKSAYLENGANGPSLRINTSSGSIRLNG